MNAQQLEAMLDLTAKVVRANPNMPLERIPIRVSKLARLASSLRRRFNIYANAQTGMDCDVYQAYTDMLKTKAVKLGRELGIGITFQPDPRGSPVVCSVGDTLYYLG